MGSAHGQYHLEKDSSAPERSGQRVLIVGNQIEGIGLGTAQFAFRCRSIEDSIATVHAAVDAGVRLIDTALAYTRAGTESYAEEVVARALRAIPGEEPLIATKGGHWRRGDQFPVDCSPQTLRAHCEISLRTLKVDRIDLYQLHHIDPNVPLSDSVGALEQLRVEGKIAAIGLSNVTVAQLDQALAFAPIAAVQNRLSFSDPGDVPTAIACADRNIAYLAYKVFGEPSQGVHEAAAMIAERRRFSVQRVLLAWIRMQSPNILPLVGASRPTSIRDSASLIELTEQDRADLAAAQGRSDSRQD
jgi:pyridoxine 4-dehydrogenase